jgi:hypothetical protein
MPKIAFIGNGETPGALLRMWRKQTPGCSGVWGQLEGVSDLKSADIFAVVDRLPADCSVDRKKCVFLGAHPPSMPHAYSDMQGMECLAKADCRDTVGFLEWWIDRDYDTLSSMEPPDKEKPLMCVMSNNNTNNSHKARLAWLDRFVRRDGLPLDLYGRIKPRTPAMRRYFRGQLGHWDGSPGGSHMAGKEKAYSEHKYALEFDVAGEHYFSERVLDSMLLWSMPIYWGCDNLHQYLPEGSFKPLDINGDGQDVLETIASGYYERGLTKLREARRILLDELQLWPMIHKLVFGTHK